MSTEFRDAIENLDEVVENTEEIVNVVKRKGIVGRTVGGALAMAALASGGVYYVFNYKKRKADKLEKQVQQNIKDLEDMGFTVIPPESESVDIEYSEPDSNE